jgi:tetratricopeptide (TPR) repeat protein
MSRRWIVVVALALLSWVTAAAQESASPASAAADAAIGKVAGDGPAGDPAELFVGANAAYEAGEHERAVELYSAIVAQGAGDGRVDYNLGNAFLRNGELGRAIAAYRRALVLRPRDHDIKANLAFARKTAKDAIQPPRPSAVLETLFFWHYELSRAELAWAALVCNLLLWAALAVRLYRPGSELLRWSVIVFLLVLLASGGSLAIRTLVPEGVAVVVPQEVEVRTGPGDDALVRFKLHAGSEVRVRDRREAWLRIELPDGKSGWLPLDQVELVTL